MTLTECAASLGVELLPWQLRAAEAIDRIEYPIIQGGLRGGKTFFFTLVEKWERAKLVGR